MCSRSDRLGSDVRACERASVRTREGRATTGRRSKVRVHTANAFALARSHLRTLARFLPLLLLAACGRAEAAPARVLKVCADPNNLPFSNRAGQGFENRLAELVARDLGA